MSVLTRTFNYNVAGTIQIGNILQFFADALDAGGIERTTDTGQIDIGSVSWPGSNTTLIGYEIREFDDSLSDTSPIVIKFEYYRWNSSDRLELFITAGTGSDGSGEITGVLVPRTQVSNGNGFMHSISSTWNTKTSLACVVDGNKIGFICPEDSGGEMVFFLERFSNDDGTDSDEGLRWVWRCGNGVTPRSWSFEFAGSVLGVNPETQGGCFPPTAQTSGIDPGTGDVALWPYFTFITGVPQMPMRTIMGIFSSDVTPQTTFVGNHVGTARTYRVVKPSGTTTNPARGSTPSSTNFTIAMLWE